MNTTFLLGNGFDVCLGLKTKYQQFYENHYAGLPKEGVSNALKVFPSLQLAAVNSLRIS